MEARFRGYYHDNPWRMSYGRMIGLMNRLGINERKTSGRGMVEDFMRNARPVIEDDDE